MALTAFRLQEQFRAAFWLAFLGMVAILGLVTLAVIMHPSDSQPVSLGITAITTLVAGAAGHAAGAAKTSSDLKGKKDTEEPEHER
jgi:hypothetical protein